MIPVLGVPILNRGDLLLDLVNSIDYPVEKLAIVQNSQEPDVVDAVEKIKGGINPHVKSVYVSVPFRNIGCGPSWNHVIKSFPEASLWVISNNDMLFHPGDLERIYTTHIENPNAFLMAVGFGLFGITPYVVHVCGLFDENIYPAYYEDNDYQFRLEKSGVQKIDVPSTVVRQEGSCTIRSNAFYMSANGQSYQMNERYFHEKWGVNQILADGSVGYKHPYNNTNQLIGTWNYDPIRRKIQNQYWNNMDSFSNKTVF
jgi:GT2 family glycosyltransferase